MALLSRRLALAQLAGVACGTSVLGASGRIRRALVCIRLSERQDGARILTSAADLDPALAGLRLAWDQGALAAVREPEEAAGRGYVAGGFSAPAWMMEAAGASVADSLGRAFTFRSGLLALTPVRQSLEYGQFENPRLIAASQGEFELPQTAIGRQLSQVAGLLANRALAQAMFVVSHGGPAGSGDADHQSEVRLKRLGDAAGAFYGVIRRLGLEADTAMFTDSDLPAAGSTRLVLGGSVLGGQVYAGTQVQSNLALARWAGVETSGVEAGGPRFLY